LKCSEAFPKPLGSAIHFGHRLVGEDGDNLSVNLSNKLSKDVGEDVLFIHLPLMAVASSGVSDAMSAGVVDVFLPPGVAPLLLVQRGFATPAVKKPGQFASLRRLEVLSSLTPPPQLCL